jgi:hypothetical protein
MRLLAVVLLAACTSTQSPDITGPVTGPVTRFAVDAFRLPHNNSDALQLADDLNGDGALDNDLGMMFNTLLFANDLTPHASDMIAAGAIASSLELQTPDALTAQRAAVRYYGADGEEAIAMDGAIIDGVFTSNRTRTTSAPGLAVLHLPVFADADPVIVELDAMELELSPGETGGYDAVLHGLVPADAAWQAVYTGLSQMIAKDPDAHYPLADLVDPGHYGSFTFDELRHNSFFQSLLAPDLSLGGRPMLSLGIGIHVIPCDAGTCVAAPAADACHDRVRDGAETDIDCGGSCGACPVAAPSCSDGVRDGLETDVDCGWNCGPCAIGHGCADERDCAPGSKCTTGLAYAPGTCVAN